MIRENVTEQGNIYGKWQIAEDTWCITDGWQNFVYLLIGEEKALLIDSCSGEGNIRAVVEGITEKPVMVLSTHGHFDHTGGNSCWPEAWMTKEAAVHAKEPFGPIHEKWFRSKPYQDYKIHYIENGQTIDLGQRTVEIISIPAHSEGSVAVLDKNTRFLFTGDEIESGQVIWIVRNQSVSLKELAQMHKTNMEKLLEYRHDYDYIWPAHNGVPLYPDRYIQDFIELDKLIIEGRQQVTEDTAGFGFPADNQAIANPFQDYGKLCRAQYGVASVIYSESSVVYHNK